MTPTRRLTVLLTSGLIVFVLLQSSRVDHVMPSRMNHFSKESPLTSGNGGRILTNINVWSPDSEWIAYDTRSDPAGDRFDGTQIEMVNTRTREVRVLYRSKNDACCGVVTWHPSEPKVAFILGPEHPTADWNYSPTHRQGVIVDTRNPDSSINLDARDLIPPFTVGALRGGSHVHVWSPDGRFVSFTYEDHVLAEQNCPESEGNQRNIGISLAGRSVSVPMTHPRNHEGNLFSVLATRTVASPRPGSDEISKAFEEGWVGNAGYLRADGTRTRYALAFQGQVRTHSGDSMSEVFIVDLPENPIDAGDEPLEGTTTRRPAPPRGVVQRRLTFTESDKYPGLQGPRHWLRSSPDGSRIGFLKKDDMGIVQFWTVPSVGGAPVQITYSPFPVASAFTWHPSRNQVAFVMDNSICVTDVDSGQMCRLTPRCDAANAPRPEACVFSPDGRRIAFVRSLPTGASFANQICVVELD